MSAWPRYPPCVAGVCADPVCCAAGKKFLWPELKGKSPEEAKAKIERENPNVTVVIIPQGRVGIPDFCCNRVYLVIDTKGKVFNIPQIG